MDARGKSYYFPDKMGEEKSIYFQRERAKKLKMLQKEKEFRELQKKFELEH